MDQRLTPVLPYTILPSMTLDIPVPHEWYKALASKGGKSVPKHVRSRASSQGAQAGWNTRRQRYGKTGHANPYAQRKLKAAA